MQDQLHFLAAAAAQNSHSKKISCFAVNFALSTLFQMACKTKEASDLTANSIAQGTGLDSASIVPLFLGKSGVDRLAVGKVAQYLGYTAEGLFLLAEGFDLSNKRDVFAERGHKMAIDNISVILKM